MQKYKAYKEWFARRRCLRRIRRDGLKLVSSAGFCIGWTTLFGKYPFGWMLGVGYEQVTASLLANRMW